MAEEVQQQEQEHQVSILNIEPVTHNVLRISVERPKNYNFIPGQATEVAINKEGFTTERRPFTFTGLQDWDHLEFTIKTYTDHPGVTNELRSLKPGDSLLLHDVWGAIHYSGEGIFIAGGAGITPFIAIFRDLQQKGKVGNNRLFFSNKTEKDIILKSEFEKILGDRFVNILTEQTDSKYIHDRIDKEFLRRHVSDMNQHFYICGPDPMVAAIQQDLVDLGAGDHLITVEV
ncbi:ferredoxin reductase domain-containing protein [Arachidicoccus terrestris]|uniref:flavodoxin reductase n=1 Tax=Arachidicoccus terrestris TaxID=2875539 RepID=UPI001CC7D8FF|nr:flavodoxin reductase [Arachidicoccus terrestris]UAY55875.1 flavodoxin reductase [Arachidicoccus terrestris]